MICNKCGAEMREGSKFCTNCGQEFVYENNVGTNSTDNENYKNKLFGFKKFIQHIPKPLIIIVPIILAVIVVIIIFVTSFNNNVDTMTYEEFIDRINEEANAIDIDKVNNVYNNHLSNSSWKEETIDVIDVSGEEGKIEEMVSYTCYPTGSAYCIQIEAYKDSHVVKSLSVKENINTMENLKRLHDYYGKYTVESLKIYSIISTKVFLGLTYDEAGDLMDELAGDYYNGHVKGDVYVKPCSEEKNIVETMSGFTMEHKELEPNDKPTIETRDRSNSTKKSDLNEESSTNKSHITNSSNTTNSSTVKIPEDSGYETVQAKDYVVYDSAGVLNESELQKMKESLTRVTDEVGVTHAIITTNSGLDMHWLETYADDYYADNLKPQINSNEKQAIILAVDTQTGNYLMKGYNVDTANKEALCGTSIANAIAQKDYKEAFESFSSI